LLAHPEHEFAQTCNEDFGVTGTQTCDGRYDSAPFPKPEFGGWGFNGGHNGTSKATHPSGEQAMTVSFFTPGVSRSFGEANRMTQFKDKSAKGGADSASVGLFTYPVLQAADILLYATDQVPVGEDQRQHLELARDLAQRFNHRFGPTFVVPQAYILPAVAKIADLQDPAIKMSKSASSPQGIIDVLEEPGAIRKKIMRAVTDADGEVRADDEAKPGVTNLLRIYSALGGQSIENLEQRYAGAGYGAFKKDLAEVVTDALAPVRERTEKLLANEAELDALLAVGAARARELASVTMTAVMDKVGFLPPR